MTYITWTASHFTVCLAKFSGIICFNASTCFQVNAVYKDDHHVKYSWTSGLGEKVHTYACKPAQYQSLIYIYTYIYRHRLCNLGTLQKREAGPKLSAGSCRDEAGSCPRSVHACWGQHVMTQAPTSSLSWSKPQPLHRGIHTFLTLLAAVTPHTRLQLPCLSHQLGSSGQELWELETKRRSSTAGRGARWAESRWGSIRFGSPEGELRPLRCVLSYF